MSEKKAKILVVDDDQMNRKMIISRLEKRGYLCDEVENGNDCLDKVLSEGPNEYDVILLDIMMPDVNGDVVLEKIRALYSALQMPVIMQTSKTENSDIVKFLKLGANDYVTKPVNIDVAIARINTQIKVKELVATSSRAKQLETMNTMVTTLNHEINNPLAIAIGQLSLGVERMTQVKVDKAINALNRITEIVKKIQSLTKEQEEIKTINYAGSINMYDLHDQKKKG
jgi:DNA-binding response OmpR family regulator